MDTSTDAAGAAPSLWQRLRHRVDVAWRGLTGAREDASTLGQEAQRYWNELNAGRRRVDAHWRGHGVFADDAVWLALGREHRRVLEEQVQRSGRTLAPRRVVEWGCGGGMNAVHFARGAERYYGVDIAQPTLDECAHQMERERLPGFVPVLVQANQPRDALAEIGAPCDLFVCTYLIELLPSPEHALELLDIVRDVLAPGGLALMQLRLDDGRLASRSRPWGYARNMAHNVTFTEAVFRAACEQRSLRVLAVVPQDEVPALGERGYAFFVLER